MKNKFSNKLLVNVLFRLWQWRSYYYDSEDHIIMTVKDHIACRAWKDQNSHVYLDSL